MLTHILISAAFISCALACCTQVSFLKISGDFTYEQGKHECRIRGGLIAVMGAASQERDISNVAPSQGWFWVGATDLVTEGTFIWDDGTPMSFTNWVSGQPDNYGGFDPKGENCLQVGWSASGPSNAVDWNDLSCMWPKYRPAGSIPCGVVCQF